MQNAQPAGVDGGCRMPSVCSLASGFGQYDTYPFVVDVVIDGAGGV